MQYGQFVASKVEFDTACGFDVPADQLAPTLLPHQRDIVRWALMRGRAALFERFGLGKTVQQLEILRQIGLREGGRQLVVCPLGVRGEFRREAARHLDIDVHPVRRTGEVDGPGIYVTNYESVRDGRLDVGLFNAVSLDEAAVLRSYGSKTYQEFLALFSQTPYRFVATATPSPNRYKELIHYAGYLGVMETGQALTRWFKRDSTKANNLTLHPHKEAEFWLWLATWSVWCQTPADLGYDATGYDLPGMDLHWHELEVDHLANVTTDRDGQAHMFRDADLGVTGAAHEKRATLQDRVDAAGALLDSVPVGPIDGNQVIIWCDLNDEQRAIEIMLQNGGRTYSSIHGGLSDDENERRLDAWRDRNTQVLIGKPVMLGQGVNLQQAHRAIFVGVTHKFEATIQACHRIHRYGQKHRCQIDLIYAESERSVRDVLQSKWEQHEELTQRMTDLIHQHGLNGASVAEALRRSIGTTRVEASGDGWTYVNDDCVKETSRLDTGSVDLIVTSIPFANHYEYTPAVEDFGHTDSNAHFWAQMDYLTPQLYRVLAPGRIYACHVKDRIMFQSVTGAGAPTIDCFHAEALMHGRKHGFQVLGMITVTTDVVRENNQTYRLTWTEQRKDATKMGVGCPEYVLLFRKPQSDTAKGYADTPVAHSKDEYSLARWQVDAAADWRSSGNRTLTPDELVALPADARQKLFTAWSLAGVYDYQTHVRIGDELDARGALPKTFAALQPGSHAPWVWHDIIRMRTLNAEQARKGDEMHLCPLQLDLVDRLIERFSNKGELVLDPFGGLGTVPMRALLAGRRGYGIELNPRYWADGVRYCQSAEAQVGAPTLFDLDALEAS